MLTAATVIVGLGAVFLSSQYMLKRKCAALRREFQEQLDSLYAQIRLLERAALPRSHAVFSSPQPSKPLSEARVAPADSPAPETALPAGEEVSPEILAVIAETVTAFLGKKVRIRSARKLQTQNLPASLVQMSSESIEAWAQQGRVFVQASHESVQARTSAASPQPAAVVRGVTLEAPDIN